MSDITAGELAAPPAPSLADRLRRRLASGRLKTSYSSELALFKTWPQRIAVLAGLLFVLVLPQVMGPYATGVATIIALTVPGAIALNLLQGVAGQVSAGNAAFLGIGAVVAAFLTTTFAGINFLIVLPISGLVAAAVGAMVALPALRVRGLYLLISTLALHQIIVYLILVYQERTVGPAGWFMPIPSLFGFTINGLFRWY